MTAARLARRAAHHGALVAYVSYALLTLRVARTSERLPLIGAQAVLGVAVASYGLLIAPTEWLQPASQAPSCSASSGTPPALPASSAPGPAHASRRPAPARLRAAGCTRPGRHLGVLVQAAHGLDLLPRNWCPFCMAQVKELAQRYRDIEGLGAWAAEIQARAGASCRAKPDAGEALDRPQQRAGNDEWPRKSPRPGFGLDPERGDPALRRLSGADPGRRVAPASPLSGANAGLDFCRPRSWLPASPSSRPSAKPRAPRCPSASPSPRASLVDDGNTLARQLGIDSLRHPYRPASLGLRQRHRDAHRRHHRTRYCILWADEDGQLPGAAGAGDLPGGVEAGGLVAA